MLCQLLTLDLEDEGSEKAKGGGRVTAYGMGRERQRKNRCRQSTDQVGGERESETLYGWERIKAVVSEILPSRMLWAF